MLKKYFKNLWKLEWKNDVPLLKKLLIMVILLSPFLLFVIYAALTLKLYKLQTP